MLLLLKRRRKRRNSTSKLLGFQESKTLENGVNTGKSGEGVVTDSYE